MTSHAMQQKRVPTQISAAHSAEDGVLYLYALCAQDGTLWRWDGARWEQLPPIPPRVGGES